MSDGGGESGRQIEHNSWKKKKRGNDDFAQSIAKIAVAQVCESAGFQGFQQSALDTLSDVSVCYIREIGKAANLCANLAGRTESNVFDIIQGLEDLGLTQGFTGASDINHCLPESGIIKEISQYVGVAEEIAFAYSVPCFPVVKEWQPKPSFAQAGETPPSEHIPPWLPKFPHPETYMRLPSANLREAEIRPNRVEQKHKVVDPLVLNLQQQLVCNGSKIPMVVDGGDVAEWEQAADYNPFLAQPVQSREKEVSSVVLPSKFLEEDLVQNHGVGENHVSALEAFTPAIEAIKSGLCDSEGTKMVLLNSRGTVQLKFSIGKKSLDAANRQPFKGIAEATSWFENDEVKDDKKRRAEKILRESMEIGEPTGSGSVVN